MKHTFSAFARYVPAVGCLTIFSSFSIAGVMSIACSAPASHDVVAPGPGTLREPPLGAKPYHLGRMVDFAKLSRLSGSEIPTTGDGHDGVGGVLFCIDKNGYVVHTEVPVSTGDLEADARALDVIQKWRFTPYTPDGKPATVCTVVAVAR